ncbi:hypothetical protein [Candidatus Enterovibrio escicola]|uniref:hypothetical protein n=1 Tax=Candidatus Enterovibrio escicola TaxID=1927127 RepID=UPI001237D616|nr:hypothetical protein [Candidatus Enterovibrio escacola]
MNKLDCFFTEIDNSCQVFLPTLEKNRILGVKTRDKSSRLSISEVITIIVSFHQSGFCNFKRYYIQYIYLHLTGEFPDLVSYTQMHKLI